MNVATTSKKVEIDTVSIYDIMDKYSLHDVELTLSLTQDLADDLQEMVNTGVHHQHLGSVVKSIRIFQDLIRVSM